MAKLEKCNIHDAEIRKLRGDLDYFKTDTNSFRDDINIKIDDIMIQLKKPFFTPYQSFGIFITFVGYMAVVMAYGGNIKSDVRANSIDVEYTKGDIKEIKSDVKEILKIIK